MLDRLETQPGFFRDQRIAVANIMGRFIAAREALRKTVPRNMVIADRLDGVISQLDWACVIIRGLQELMARDLPKLYEEINTKMVDPALADSGQVRPLTPEEIEARNEGDVIGPLPRFKPWKDYPPGTKAISFRGGWWTRTEQGWKANGGDTFPTPGADVRFVEEPPVDG